MHAYKQETIPKSSGRRGTWESFPPTPSLVIHKITTSNLKMTWRRVLGNLISFNKKRSLDVQGWYLCAGPGRVHPRKCCERVVKYKPLVHNLVKSCPCSWEPNILVYMIKSGGSSHLVPLHGPLKPSSHQLWLFSSGWFEPLLALET